MHVVHVWHCAHSTICNLEVHVQTEHVFVHAYVCACACLTHVRLCVCMVWGGLVGFGILNWLSGTYVV